MLALAGFGALLVALAPDWLLQLKRRSIAGSPQPVSERAVSDQRREGDGGRGDGEHGAGLVHAEQSRQRGVVAPDQPAVQRRREHGGDPDREAARTTATTARADQSVASHQAPVATRAR